MSERGEYCNDGLMFLNKRPTVMCLATPNKRRFFFFKYRNCSGTFFFNIWWHIVSKGSFALKKNPLKNNNNNKTDHHLLKQPPSSSLSSLSAASPPPPSPSSFCCRHRERLLMASVSHCPRSFLLHQSAVSEAWRGIRHAIPHPFFVELRGSLPRLTVAVPVNQLGVFRSRVQYAKDWKQEKKVKQKKK